MVVAPTSKRPRPMRTDLIDVLEERERKGERGRGEEKKGKKEGGVQVRGYSKEEEEEKVK